MNVYFLGKLISAEGNAVQTDRLGSARSGGPSGLGYQAQYPYGAEYTLTANDREKYATYTRDSATGLDYAMNRYYASQWGRFLSPDPTYLNVDLERPQSWNMYAYVDSDPVNSNDPTGQMQYICDVNPFLPQCPGMSGPPGGGGGGGGSPVACAVIGVWPGPVPMGAGCGGGNGSGYGGASGPRNYTVSNYSRTGPNEDRIATVLNDILNEVLNGNCGSWLTGAQFSAAQFINAIEGSGPQDYTFGYGALNVASTAAFVGNDNPDGSPIQGLPSNATITVNSNGAFFSSNFQVGSGSTEYAGGTLQAQAFILVHELAHAVGATGFKPDNGSPTNQASNNALVQKNCGSQIAGIH